jgi:hypothetical protein
MLEAARTSETLVNFYQTTRRYNPEDSQQQICVNISFPTEDETQFTVIIVYKILLSNALNMQIKTKYEI